jgi:peptidoglycan/xylan/chitin deacetylase (PgdA/CDA1 family)
MENHRHAHQLAAIGLLAAGLVQALAGIGRAEVRGSANYSIVAEGIDVSFSPTSSADYLVEASVDIIGGTGATPVGEILARNGFKGALYEVTAVAVVATPSGIDETSAYAPSTAQLSGTATYGDETTAVLGGGDLSWSVVTGPIASISSLGVATAGAVAEDTTAIFSGRHADRSASGTLVIREVDPDNFGGYADDGLPDWWQLASGLSAAEAGRDLDPDNDGLTNAAEFAHLLDPLAPDASRAVRAEITEADSERYFGVTFRRNRLALDLFDISARRSTGLRDWSPEGLVEVSVTEIDAATESVAVRSTTPMRLQQREFITVFTSGPYVAMTFDDGPHPTRTPALLDILLARGVSATFFVVGTNAGLYPAILQRMVNEGHEIGNHSQTHADFTSLSDAQVRAELDACHAAIVAATGVEPVLTRPPYGALTQDQRVWIPAEYGYRIVFWDVDPLDWQKPGSGVVADRIVTGTANRAVVLSHDIHAETIDAMPLAIDRLLARGYRFVTVSELLTLASQ